MLQYLHYPPSSGSACFSPLGFGPGRLTLGPFEDALLARLF